MNRVFKNGAIELEGEKGVLFKVNGQRLKFYFGDVAPISMIEMVYLADA